MPRASREQAQKNRTAIENASARLFREQGLNGVSVAQLMAAAGLTHGGFYGHFSSKDELAAVACAAAFGQSAERWAAQGHKYPDAHQTLQAIVSHYLRDPHRDQIGTGCPAVALAGDVIRETPNKPVHHAYTAGVEQMAFSLATLLEKSGSPKPRRTALTTLATMVGALVLARATREAPISEDILAAARDLLLDPGVPDN